MLAILDGIRSRSTLFVQLRLLFSQVYFRQMSRVVQGQGRAVNLTRSAAAGASRTWKTGTNQSFAVFQFPATASCSRPTPAIKRCRLPHADSEWKIATSSPLAIANHHRAAPV